MENKKRHRQDIYGWGVDADPKNYPEYPMKARNENDNKGMIWERPTQQNSDVEVLKSNERPALTAVFGTPNPPQGLSGAIRRFAFRYSESSYGHWLSLLLADRINVVEGLIDDVRQGKFPNIFAELGGRAELKHNPAGFVRKTVGVVAVTVAFLYLCKRNRSRRS
jgi:hypothetical protein